MLYRLSYLGVFIPCGFPVAHRRFRGIGPPLALRLVRTAVPREATGPYSPRRLDPLENTPNRHRGRLSATPRSALPAALRAKSYDFSVRAVSTRDAVLPKVSEDVDFTSIRASGEYHVVS